MSGMREYPGAAQTERSEDGMNGMDTHTRKRTQARYGEGARTRRRKRHEKGLDQECTTRAKYTTPRPPTQSKKKCLSIALRHNLVVLEMH